MISALRVKHRMATFMAAGFLSCLPERKAKTLTLIEVHQAWFQPLIQIDGKLAANNERNSAFI